MGALYGMAMEAPPRGVRSQLIPFFGSLFGSALFLGADEMAVPALGLSKAAESPSSHFYGWAPHAGYGLRTELVRGQIGTRTRSGSCRPKKLGKAWEPSPNLIPEPPNRNKKNL